jgi:hypothetical protein
MKDNNICYGGGVAHTLSHKCIEDKHSDAANRLNVKERPLVDGNSFALAEHFLTDHRHSEDQKWDLADCIQKAVEAWFDEEMQ